jgi:hypothetical protein
VKAETIYIDFSIYFIVKCYFVIILTAVVFFTLYEEGIATPDSSVNKRIRAHLGARDFHTYLAEDTLDLPYDDEVPECDYKTMTTKRFYNDYLKANRPCLFKGYGRSQRAYDLW